MAFTVNLINVSPRGDVSLYVDDQQHEVPAGGVLTVTPETAGEAPHWRRADDLDDQALRLNPLALHFRVRAGALEVFDLGDGLLSQAENWRAEGDTADPADPAADGHGGIIDAGQAAQALAEYHRATDHEAANPLTPDAETENS